MLPDRVSNPGPLTYESGALPIALRGPADSDWIARLELSSLCLHCLPRMYKPVTPNCQPVVVERRNTAT